MFLQGNPCPHPQEQLGYPVAHQLDAASLPAPPAPYSHLPLPPFLHVPLLLPLQPSLTLHTSATLTLAPGNEAVSGLKPVMLKDIFFFFQHHFFFRVAAGSRPRSAYLMFILSRLPGGSCIPAVPVLNLCFFSLFSFLSCCSPPPWNSTCSPGQEYWGDGGALPGAVFTSQASSRASSLSPLKISTTNPTTKVKAASTEAELKANDIKDGKASSRLRGRAQSKPGHPRDNLPPLGDLQQRGIQQGAPQVQTS